MADVLAVVGSARFACRDGVEIARRIVAAEITERRPDLVVSGGAVGVDSIAAAVARAAGVEVTEFLPRHRRWEPEGFKARNIVVAGACTRLLAIRCAESRTYGSGYTRDLAGKQGKPTRTVVVGRDGQVRDTGWCDVEPGARLGVT